jgi:prepilin-type processing-associated H-X9-DG protein
MKKALNFIAVMLGGLCLGGVTAAAAQQAAAGGAAPLARYIPREGLSLLVEWDGMAAHRASWNQTSAHRMLSETTLGRMLRETFVQVAEAARSSNAALPPISSEDAIAILNHLITEGHAIGVCSSAPNSPPDAVVVVIRKAKGNPLIARLLEGTPPARHPETRQVTRGERTVNENAAMNLIWWYEGEDLVYSFARDPKLGALAVLSGETPSAIDHPTRQELSRRDEVIEPIGWFHVDMKVFPPLPPDAVKAGLDGLRSLSYRWGIKDKALVSQFEMETATPRKGALQLLDQPALSAERLPRLPEGVSDYTVLSLDLAGTIDHIASLVSTFDPRALDPVRQPLAGFEQRTGISLKNDLFAHIGPELAVFTFPKPAASSGSIVDLWMHVPRAAIVAHVRDADALAGRVDELMTKVNGELAAMGGAFLPRGGGAPRTVETGAASFRKLPGNERGYVLLVPPAVLPVPAELRPTLLIGKSHAVLATSPEVARATLAFESGAGGQPISPALPPGTIFQSRSDPRGYLPELLVNIPSIVQAIGGLATMQPQAGGQRFSLMLDPEIIPRADALRPYLFPKVVNTSIVGDRLVTTTTEAFPGVDISMSPGMSVPVLVALLLPAVQSAREAARRAQCTNNLKQIALAAFNYESATGKFPGDIVDEDGKPLLSWRVAILPFIEQNALHQQFHLDEPWDSEHNLAVARSIPATYLCPSRNRASDDATTTYVRFVGPGALSEKGEGVRLADITDGTSNTIMVVESATEIPWTKPEDLPFDPENPGDLFGAGSMHPGGFNAAFADGSVRFIKRTIAVETLRSLITRAGGEVVNAID